MTYDYADIISKGPNTPVPSDIVEVKVKVEEGLTTVELPGSITTPFTINAEVIQGTIPKHSEAKKIRLRLYHDWSDTLVKDNAILTLRYNQEGRLFDIKDFVVTGIHN